MKPSKSLRLSLHLCAVTVSSLFILLSCNFCLETDACAATNNLTKNDQAHPPTEPAKKNAFPDELEIFSHHAEEIYALAKANKWKSMEKSMGALKASGKSVNLLQNEESVMLLPPLVKTMSDLEEAVLARKRTDAMRLANKITLIEAAMAAPLKPRVPTNVGLLAYYGRELEIWSEAKDLEKLSGTVVRMHIAWQTLIPRLNTPDDIKIIKRFAEILKRLDLAKTPEEYGRLASQVQDEVENMEKAFKNEPLRSKPRSFTK